MGTRRLEVVISGDAASLSRALGGVQRDLGKAETASEKFGRRLGGLAKAGAFAGGALLAFGAKVGVQELVEAEKAAARTANVIETTGGAANVTAAQVADLSSKIQGLTGTQDDQIQSSANLLLSFTKIRNEAGANNDIFDRAVAVTNDLSVAFGKDLASSSIMVGKALNDPIKGITALGRAGVQFTDAQKDQIAAMVESGNVLGAQKMILAELTTQVGGAAAAEGEITEATQRAQRQFEDMAEGIMARVVPAVVAFGGFLQENAQTIGVVSGVAAAGVGGLIAYAGALKVVAAASALSRVSTMGFMGALGLSPAALAVMAAAAVVGFGAYVLLRDGTDVAADATARMTDQTRAAADAHRATSAAVDAQKDALDRLAGTSLSVKEAKLRLEEATLRVAAAEKKFGAGSIEHRRALLDLQRATQGVTQSRRDHLKAAEDALRTTKEGNRAIDEEVEKTQERVRGARDRAEAVRRGIITGAEATRITKDLAQAEDAAGRASATAAKKHRDNAQRAAELAENTGGATQRARNLRDALRKLSQQELNMASAIQAMNAVAGAANAARSGVDAVVAALARASSAPRLPVAGLSFGAGSGTTTTNSNPYKSDAVGGGGLNFNLARVPVGSSTDLARVGGTRDRLATTARADAEAGARGGGGDEAAIRAAGERAYLNARKGTIDILKGRIRSRRNKLVAALRKVGVSARMRVKVPKSPPEKRQAALDRRASMKQKQGEIQDELESLAADWADLTVEAREVGDNLTALDRGDESDSGSDAADPGPTAGDYLDAAAANATLTAGLDDDIAAADAIALAAHHAYNAAIAGGDPRVIADAARALQQARQNAEQLRATQANTDAVKANTEVQKQSFAGSVAFGFRGQGYVLGSLALPSSDRLTGLEVGI